MIGIFSGAKIAVVLVVLAAAGGGFMYVKKLQSDLKVSEANNLKLEQSVESQKAVIEQQIKDMKEINQANEEQRKLVDQLNKSLDGLKDKFNKVNASGKQRDIGNLMEQKPKIMERILNKGTKNAQRCVEIATGAELTEKELNAKKKSEINPECPELANPNYIPY